MNTARAARQAPPVDRSPPSEPGRIARGISGVMAVVSATVVAAALSVVVEWAGMAAGWWGERHALTLLIRERSYIEAIDRYPLTSLAPVQVADHVAVQVEGAMRWLGWQHATHAYLVAAINTLKLVALRLTMCVLIAPAFVLVSVVALIDGLVARDIRKYEGGHESSYLFHKAKRFVVPSVMLTVSIYLMLPVSIPPVVVFAPALTLTASMIYVASSRFKKYL